MSMKKCQNVEHDSVEYKIPIEDLLSTLSNRNCTDVDEEADGFS